MARGSEAAVGAAGEVGEVDEEDPVPCPREEGLWGSWLNRASRSCNEREGEEGARRTPNDGVHLRARISRTGLRGRLALTWPGGAKGVAYRPRQTLLVWRSPPIVEPPTPLDLTGGVVAHNEEGKVAQAVRSLLDQTLPPGVRWERVWVIASGCTDGTVAVARELARHDPRVEVVVDPVRRGKAAAVAEVLERAQGRRMVLLNGDARAEPGAVQALLEASKDLASPFGVMARPLPPPAGASGFLSSVELLWDLHHAVHDRLLTTGRGTHLSDEMLLLSSPEGLPTLPSDVVNDGAYLAARLKEEGGALRYASRARVIVSVPLTFRDHVAQRRRILYGHHQVTERLGVPPTTFPRFARTSPGEAVVLLVDTVLRRKRGVRSFLLLATAELTAFGLSLWDRLPPRPDHVRWVRLPEGAPRPEHTPP